MTPLSLFCLFLEEERQVSFLHREVGFPSLTTVSMFEVTSLVLWGTTAPREPALSQGQAGTASNSSGLGQVEARSAAPSKE